MIRKATPSDINTIVALYHEVLTHEEQTQGHSNWQKGIYPTRITAERAVSQNTMYLLEHRGQLCAAMILNKIQGDCYASVSWHFPAEAEEVRVIHTLCVCPSLKGKGIAGQMLSFARKQAEEEKARVIRLDTYSGNEPAKNLYRKHGYRIAGQAKTRLEGLIEEELTLFELRL